MISKYKTYISHKSVTLLKYVMKSYHLSLIIIFGRPVGRFYFHFTIIASIIDTSQIK